MLPSRVGGAFMDMGTGKSRTGIELVKRRVNKIDKVVWLSPVSLKATVQQEILKHTDCAESDVYRFDDKTNPGSIPPASWYCVGIESISGSDRAALALRELITPDTFVILDESQYCKSPFAKRTRRITEYSKNCRYRLAMTGTPVSQGAEDLFAQMYFLSPKILGYNSFYSFAANHLEYSDRYPGRIVRAHNEEYLAAKIAPYVYQVTKDECLTLPPKLYSTYCVDLTSEQREQYEYVKERFERTIDQYEEIPSTAIFKLFLSLQQVVSGYYKTSRGKVIELANERIDLLMDVIRMIPGDEKIVIWAKFRYDIDRIGERLTAVYGPDSIAYYHGGLTERERNRSEEKFHREAKFFLATRSTGGHGLTLVDSCYCIDYDKQYKAAEQLQAEDRVHRIGQTRKVTIIDLVAVNSIDAHINDALSRKQNFALTFRDEMNAAGKSKWREIIRTL